MNHYITIILVMLVKLCRGLKESYELSIDACFYVIADACLLDLHELWISSGIA